MANEVAARETYQLATIDPAELRAIFRENVGSDGVSAFDLARVKIPAAGGLTWQVPTLEGEQSMPALRGIIVHRRDVRSYWEHKFGEGEPGAPPECSSADGLTGVGDPGGDCSTCPLNEWGSAGDGKKGKACRQLKLIFLVRENEFMPLVLVLSPTSIPAAKKYFLGLSSRALPFHGVVTEWTLERAKNPAGIAYAKAVPRLLRKLELEEHVKVAANAKTI